MYTVSNTQMRYIKQYIAIMIDRTPLTDTKSYNQRRMARNLRRVLEAKQPLPKPSASDLSEVRKP